MMKLVLLVLAMAGCSFGATTPETVYYVVEAPPTTASVATPRQATVFVRKLGTSPAYDRNELVYRTQALQLRLHEYDLWAARPGRMVADAIAQHLAGTRMFASVVTGASEQLPDYELRGEVIVIDARDLGDGQWVARLELRVELVVMATDEVLWQHQLSAERPIAKHTPTMMVAALDAILGEELGRMSASLEQALPR